MAAEVVGLEIGLMGADEIRDLSVGEVTETSLLVRGRPKVGGAIDARFGSASRYQPCGTCLKTNCSGHTGSIELPYPLPHVGYIQKLVQTLNVICVACAALLTDKVPAPVGKVYAEVKKAKAYKRSLCLCPRCGLPQPSITITEPLLSAVWRADTVALHKALDEPRLTDAELAEAIAAPYTNWTASYLLRSVSHADQRRLGIDPDVTSLEGMLMRVILVPAITIRLPPPCDDGDTHGRDQHQLSVRISEVVKNKIALVKAAEQNGFDLADPEGPPPTSEPVLSALRQLYWHIASYHIKDKAKVPCVKLSSYAERGFAKQACIGSSFSSKTGLFRGNLMGKRVDHCARTVITGAPELDIDEIGVPERIARTLTVPIPVTSFNRAAVQRLIAAGKVKQLVDDASGTIIPCAAGQTPKMLCPGFVAERFLQNGDVVVLNRQPTLHRCSIMAHRVRVVPGLTLQLHPSCTAPYNADFDGDEMNMHVPQTAAARAEAKHLLHVCNHLLHPRQLSPAVGLIQDGLIAWHLLTQPGVLLTRAEVGDLLSVVQYDPSTPGSVPINATPVTFDAAAAVLRQPPAARSPDRWSGRQVASAVLPPCVTLHKGSVDILRGQLLRGTFSKATLGAASGSVVHAALLYGGGHVAARMLSDMQRVANRWLMTAGFNIGAADVQTSRSCDAVVRRVVDELRSFVARVRAVGLSGPPTQRVADAVEAKTSEALRQCLVLVGNVLGNSVDRNSALHTMVAEVRSKGSQFNAAQSMGLVAQTFVSSARPGITPACRKRRRRNLPSEPLVSTPEACRLGTSADLAAHGFVDRPFKRGLRVASALMQASGGREGLVYTSAKTPVTGYIQRQSVKSLENVAVTADLTVRDCNKQLIQRRYGVDGLDQTRLLDVELQLLGKSDADVSAAIAPAALPAAIAARDAARDARRTVFLQDLEAVAMLPFDAAVLLRAAAAEKRCCRETTANGRAAAAAAVEAACTTLERETEGHARFAAAHLWWAVAAADRVCGLCAAAACDEAVRLHRQARMLPGEAVGALAATSCGEPATQLTLNVFHAAGTGKGVLTTAGVPRLKELIAVSRQVVSVTTLRVHSRADAERLAAELPQCLLRHVVSSAEVVRGGDRALRHAHRAFLDGCGDFAIRFTLDREKATERQIGPQQVAARIRRELDADATVVLASKASDPEWIVRVHGRLEAADKRRCSVAPMHDSGVPTKSCSVPDLARWSALRGLKEKLLRTLTLRGVPRVQLAAVRTTTAAEVDPCTGGVVRREVHVVDIKGGSLAGLSRLPDIDLTTLVTNNVVEAYNILGVDSAAAVLFHELQQCYAGSRVAQSLIKVLVDYVCHSGVLLSLNRHGVNKVAGRSALQKGSFEEPLKCLLEAAHTGLVDPLEGVSEQVMLGKVTAVGTGRSGPVRRGVGGAASSVPECAEVVTSHCVEALHQDTESAGVLYMAPEGELGLQPASQHTDRAAFRIESPEYVPPRQCGFEMDSPDFTTTCGAVAF